MSGSSNDLLVHWIHDPFWGALNNLSCLGLRALPCHAASEAGRLLGIAAGRYRHRDLTARSDAILERLRPELDPPARAALLEQMWGNVGRVNAEMAVIDRLWDGARITIVNGEIISRAARAKQSMILVFPHLGNWELLAVAAQKLGATLNVVYENLSNRFERRLATRLRERLGYRLIAPTLDGARQLFAALERGEAVGLAIDEHKKGDVIAPVFGRALPADANMRFATRLARRFGALLVPAYCLRTGALDFRLTALDALHNPDPEELNAIFEKLVREHAEQWFMLHRMRLPGPG